MCLEDSVIINICWKIQVFTYNIFRINKIIKIFVKQIFRILYCCYLTTLRWNINFNVRISIKIEPINFYILLFEWMLYKQSWYVYYRRFQMRDQNKVLNFEYFSDPPLILFFNSFTNRINNCIKEMNICFNFSALFPGTPGCFYSSF